MVTWITDTDVFAFAEIGSFFMQKGGNHRKRLEQKMELFNIFLQI